LPERCAAGRGSEARPGRRLGWLAATRAG
jgi:hypothetical protein